MGMAVAFNVKESYLDTELNASYAYALAKSVL